MFGEWQDDIEILLSFLGEHIWLRALVIVACFWALAWVVDRFVVGTIRLLTRKTSSSFDDDLLEFLHRPIYLSVILIGIASAAVTLNLGEQTRAIVFPIIKMLALLVWTAFAFRLTRYLLRTMAHNPARMKWLHMQTLPLFENLANILIAVFAIYYLFTLWSIDMTAWLASAGIVGIAVGFAAKDTLANLFSGVFILADAPYKIGDFIVLDGQDRGEVTKIGLRSTRLLTRDDVEVTVPNAVIGNSKIINESGGPHLKFRIRVKVGVAYGSDIDVVGEVLMGVAHQEEGVCTDPDPRVRFRQFGASSLDFELLCWVDEPVKRGQILDRLNGAIYKRFLEEGIEIPYSKQDVYIKEMPGDNTK